MPKIKTIQRQVLGQCIDFHLYYSTKKLEFYFKDIPNEIIKLVGEAAGKPTEAETENGLDALLNQYHQAKESLQKMIIWRFQVAKNTYQDEVWKPKNWFGEKGVYLSHEDTGLFDKSFTSGYTEGNGFNLCFETVFIRTNKEIRYHKIERDEAGTELPGHSFQLGQDWRQMDYTPEREAFFKAMAAGTRTLAKQITDFLGLDDVVLLGEIDASGTKALPITIEFICN